MPNDAGYGPARALTTLPRQRACPVDEGGQRLRTRDLGGAANTVACGKAVADALA